jgi:hypothetical protein
MDRLKKLDRFYELLQQLAQKTGTHILNQCDIHMEWPQQGIYFFFEPGELRDDGKTMRVVMVGVANPPGGPQSALWDSLREHRGTISGKFAGGGNHRISQFRHYVGNALISRDNLICPSWKKLDVSNTAIRKKEHFLEVQVSQVINNMPFLWISTDRSLKPEQLNMFIQRHAIALLSNYRKKTPYDLPSPEWLGRHCPNDAVQLAGLWNDRYIDVRCNPKFLDYLEKLVQVTD